MFRAYKGWYFAPYAREVPEKICPFCGADCRRLNNFATSIHYRRCFLNGRNAEVEKELVALQEKVFAETKKRIGWH